MGWIFLGLLVIAGIVYLKWFAPERVANKLPAVTHPVLGLAALALFVFGMWNNLMFYAQPSYNYHVRDQFGSESFVIAETGWKWYGFGYVEAFKRAMSVQSVGCNGSLEVGETSSTMGPYPIRLLDRVDGKICATVRFKMPDDPTMFKRIVRDYRTQENLINTALIPAWKKVVNATSSMMTAENYYSGGRTDFIHYFEDQMRNGTYQIEIQERKVKTEQSKGSSNVAKGVNQDEFGEDTKVVYEVNIKEGDDHLPLRNQHNFFEFGITVVSADFTDFNPNPEFVERMKKQQDASANRALAKEKRLQEEEQRLFAIAEGKRKVSEEQYKAQVEQAKLTTDAETQKQLALTKANREKEAAEISKLTSKELLAKAKIDAEAVKVTADAEAYKKRQIIKADNALAQKLEAIKFIAQVQAEAQAKRQVPSTVIYSGTTTEGAMGTGDDVQKLLQTQLLKNLGVVDLNMNIKK